MQSAHNQTKSEILKSRKGKVFFSSNFSQYGTDVSIRHSFSRLCKEEF